MNSEHVIENTNVTRIKKKINKKTVRSLNQLIIGSVLYSIGLVWFINAGDLFAGGLTGISQIISYAIFNKIVPWLGLIIFAVNVPLLMLGWRGLSKKFAILSIVSIVIQALSVSGFQMLYDWGFNYENQLVLDNGGRLLMAILGGVLTGYANSLCLKSGGSSGGMDIITNYLFVKKNISFTKYSFVVDFIIVFFSAIIRGAASALFTIVRVIVGVITINHFYTTYQVVKIQITTEFGDDVREALLSRFHHGLTIYPVIGGYTLKEKNMIEAIVSKYEVDDYIRLVHSIDKKAFISVSVLNLLRGNYNKRTVL